MKKDINYYLSMGMDQKTAEYFVSGRKKIVAVTPNDDFTLTLTFDNGEKRICDMHRLLKKGTIFEHIMALADFKRPNLTVHLPKINEYYLAQLFYMLEMQTAIIGELYDIDAFNQPGVEQAKNYTYALMGRLGYEESAAELNEKINRSINA